jgi:hypothetical protein
MKPQLAPRVPGTTPWKRLDNAVRLVFSVPKEAVLREEARLKKLKRKKRSKKKAIA